jgi:hypothetical protein
LEESGAGRPEAAGVKMIGDAGGIGIGRKGRGSEVEEGTEFLVRGLMGITVIWMFMWEQKTRGLQLSQHR